MNVRMTCLGGKCSDCHASRQPGHGQLCEWGRERCKEFLETKAVMGYFDAGEGK